MEELVEHRQTVAERDESLPQRAGRALKKLEVAYAAHTAAARERTARPVETSQVTAKRKYRKNTNRKISVKSVVQPKPNVEKLAQALLEIAKDIAEQKR